ncbi:MAG TPA: UvrD-helicase domain-containing protein, partial [Polyangiaceae bacterium]|nr:UvrD-helicase domain-containing protein [Polyangiaceae bacterium]
SDPAMNWRISALDRYRLVSSSDAHSPAKLGREATLLHTAPDYYAIRRALETGDGFGGTVEFFPEEGKYHLDGHRKCNVRLEPGEAIACGKRCPACGAPLTLGVLHRVEELADHPEGRRPENAAPFDCLVALPEVLAETLGATSASQRVQAAYERLLSRLGAELFILKQAPIEDIERSGSSLLGEAIARMRAGRVRRQAGYDGEYGVIRMFEPGEIDRRTRLPLAGLGLDVMEPVAVPASVSASVPVPMPVPAAVPVPMPVSGTATALDAGCSASLLVGLDAEQLAAASASGGALLVVAGPGTGKTRTLTQRIAQRVLEQGVAPEACLALTFSRRAAAELSERLDALLGPRARRLGVFTFHGLGAAILREHGERIGLSRDLRIASEAERVALLAAALDVEVREAQALLKRIARLRRAGAALEAGSELEQARAAYERHLRAAGAVDFDDLIGLAVQLFDSAPDVAASHARRYRHICIDEYQDIDALQYRLVRALVSEGAEVCAIGDPDQAIYSFRGADVRFFLQFERDFAPARRVELTQSYRSSAGIVDSALAAIRSASLVPERVLRSRAGAGPQIVRHEASSDRDEAEFIVRRIEALIGGYGFDAIDSGRIDSGDGHDLGFADFAVLYRTARQLDALEQALTRAGLPFQQRSHTQLLDRPRVAALIAALPADGDGPLRERLERAAAALGEFDRADAGAGDGAAGPDAWRAVLELLAPVAERCGDDRQRFLAELACTTEIDTWDPRAARVALLTLHASKGLEFECVFIPGCEDGILPLRFGPRVGAGGEGVPDMDAGLAADARLDARDEGVLEAEHEAEIAEAEERRLFFVGMTRARRRLFLTSARSRFWLGKLRHLEPSPFLAALPSTWVETSRSAEARREPRQLELF